MNADKEQSLQQLRRAVALQQLQQRGGERRDRQALQAPDRDSVASRNY